MKTLRSVLIGLTATALLGIPGAALGASAAGPSSSADTGAALSRLAAARHSTSIRFLAFDHIRPASTQLGVKGQVAASVGGHQGALGGVQVKLYRQLNGNNAWVYLDTAKTSNGSAPAFFFNTFARQNAHYKVVFAGNSQFGPSGGITWLDTYRLFHGAITDGRGAATLHGHVTPYYTHKAISLQKRACAACGYVTIKKATTGNDGAYSFALPAPHSGRWWWRVVIPGTTAYIQSFGGTFTTQLR